MEEWKEITNYPNYIISNKGSVKNIVSNKLLNPYERKGYLHVNLVNNTGKKEVKIHRLVGLHFISNPNNLPDINHKDETKNNNHYTNLEWCTKQYNNTYGTRIEKVKQKLFVKVQKFTLDNTFIEEYNSIDEAGNSNNISPCNISNTLKGKQKTAGGFIWKYN